jgi:serine/threonine-protein kinase RsbT
MPEEIRVPINADHDLVAARQAGRDIARELGFSTTDQTLIATAISEIARNIVQYARNGEIVVTPVVERHRKGMVIVATDIGPGIPDVEMALREGYTTSASGLGLGLPGARRLVEEFHVTSELGRGTTVVMKKWVGGG